jgi:L,D-peptidoglycan transpeptidase YkuD (ErfK/YbiS/YcfS/YnhG family)
LNTLTSQEAQASIQLNSLDSSQQLVVVKSLQNIKARLTILEKDSQNQWATVKSYPAVVGLKGIAPLGEKREGDKRTPSGLYEFSTSWGYAAQAETQMPYIMVTDEDKFIDDIDSEEYNTWVRGPTTAKSFEKMKRSDNLYELGLVIDYNTHPVVKGFGSAIFLHIWQSSQQGTSGCVAVSKATLQEIFKWLDLAKKPQILIKGN